MCVWVCGRRECVECVRKAGKQMGSKGTWRDPNGNQVDGVICSQEDKLNDDAPPCVCDRLHTQSQTEHILHTTRYLSYRRDTETDVAEERCLSLDLKLDVCPFGAIRRANPPQKSSAEPVGTDIFFRAKLLNEWSPRPHRPPARTHTENKCD